ncbi:Hypothetical protein A7982_06365 [Minicystis rosea]|nr:Hypothetical protein A7982_06365 [Minicystis rosea]
MDRRRIERFGSRARGLRNHHTGVSMRTASRAFEVARVTEENTRSARSS